MPSPVISLDGFHLANVLFAFDVVLRECAIAESSRLLGVGKPFSSFGDIKAVCPPHVHMRRNVTHVPGDLSHDAHD